MMIKVRTLVLATGLLATAAAAQTAAPQKPDVPDWAQPGSATHTQVAPPSDFHRPTQTTLTPLGIFEGQSDVGSPAIPGASSYDAATASYTITSAGYNIWYGRDEFRYVWKRMSGDVSLAADVAFPNPTGYDDRKAVLIIRQSLDDNSAEVLAGVHGVGMVQLARRPETGALIRDMEYRINSRGDLPGGNSPTDLITANPRRIGIEKHGDEFQLYVSAVGEPLHPFGPPMHLHIDGPFYVGIGFCSHMPDKADTAVLNRVVLENVAGKVS